MLEQILQTAMRSAQITCVLGSTNKEESIRKTNGYVVTAGIRASCFTTYSKAVRNFKNGALLEPHDYHLEVAEESKAGVILQPDLHSKWKLFANPDEAFDSIYAIKKDELDPKINKYIHPLSASLVSKYLRSGNCNDLASVIYCDLWQKASKNPVKYPIHHLEILYFDDFRHQVLVVNRLKGSLRTEPATWGEDTWIVDAWWEGGKIFRSNEFEEKFEEMKNYVLQQEEFVNESAPIGYVRSPSSQQDEISFAFYLLDSVRPLDKPFPENLAHQISFDEFSSSLHHIDFKNSLAEHRQKSALLHLNIKAVVNLKKAINLNESANKLIEQVKTKIAEGELKTAKTKLQTVNQSIRKASKYLGVYHHFLRVIENDKNEIDYAQAEVLLLQTKYQHILNQAKLFHAIAFNALEYIKNQKNSMCDRQVSNILERSSRRNIILRLEKKYETALNALQSCLQHETSLGYGQNSINTKNKIIETFLSKGDLLFQEAENEIEFNTRFEFLIKSAESFRQALSLENCRDVTDIEKAAVYYLHGLRSLSSIVMLVKSDSLMATQIECFKDVYCRLTDLIVNSENMNHSQKMEFYYYIFLIHKFLIKYSESGLEDKKHVDISVLSAKIFLNCAQKELLTTPLTIDDLLKLTVCRNFITSFDIARASDCDVVKNHAEEPPRRYYLKMHDTQMTPLNTCLNEKGKRSTMNQTKTSRKKAKLDYESGPRI